MSALLVFRPGVRAPDKQTRRNFRMRSSHQNNSLFQMTDVDSHSIAWHSLSEDDTQIKLQADMNGLSQSQVEERLLEFGKNTLPSPKPPALLLVVLHQFVRSGL